MFEQAVQEGMEAISLAARQAVSGPNLIWTYYIVCASYSSWQPGEAEEVALAAISRCKDHLDPRFVLVIVYHRLRRWDDLERQRANFPDPRRHGEAP